MPPGVWAFLFSQVHARMNDIPSPRRAADFRSGDHRYECMVDDQTDSVRVTVMPHYQTVRGLQAMVTVRTERMNEARKLAEALANVKMAVIAGSRREDLGIVEQNLDVAEADLKDSVRALDEVTKRLKALDAPTYDVRFKTSDWTGLIEAYPQKKG